MPPQLITSAEPVNEGVIDDVDDDDDDRNNVIKGLLPADLQGQGGSRMEAGDHGLLNRDVGIVLRGGIVSNHIFSSSGSGTPSSSSSVPSSGGGGGGN